MPVSGPSLDKPVDLIDELRLGVDTKPGEIAVVSSDRRLTWRELDAASDRLAANLLDLGLKQGDRVASLMPNRAVLPLHYLACMKAGLVATPLNYRYMAPEIDHALAVSGAAVLLAHAERDADVAASKRAGELPLGIIRHGADDGRSPSLEELIDRQPPNADLPSVDRTTPAFIFFTSGSTGPAKGVTHSFETMGWIAASKIKALEFTPADVYLTASSLSHEGGVAFCFASLAAGARVLIAPTSDADDLLPLLRDERPTVVWILPAALINLVRDQGATREDFASLRICTAGGDKVPIELEQEFADLAGFRVDESYGMTEVGFATVNPISGVIKDGSIGMLCPRFEGDIRGDDGAELATGEQGRLWLRSPTMTIGYWNDAKATAEAIRDGWLNTGDVMKFDDDGYLWFRGRKKQIIVHDGSNICPQEVEGALLAHPAVESAGVIGIHNLAHGENVRAYVTLKDGMPRPTAQELIRFARARVGYKAPEDVVFLDEMPLTPVGKMDRVTLKQMAAEQLWAEHVE